MSRTNALEVGQPGAARKVPTDKLRGLRLSVAPGFSRRRFLQAAAALLAAPCIVPARVFGAGAPSNRIAIGAIGVGRMGMADLGDLMGRAEAQVVAVCDVDAKRAESAKGVAEKRYGPGVATYRDFRELLARPDIDAVQIVTPDHWHALPAIAAARAGKDIFMEKPLTYTLHEGRVLSDTVRRYGRVFQCGSQQRSDGNFRFACELVRNGRIGKVHTIKVGLPSDPGGPVRPAMPVPANLDYEFWLGPAPWVAYTEDRVHPQNSIGGRPGWLRVRDYCLGMITGWGAHHNDIAQWGLGTELSGPVEVTGSAGYPADGVWDVHTSYHIEYTYANGTKLLCSGDYPNGTRFEGEHGWVFVTRGRIDAEPKALLRSTIGAGEVHLYESRHHKQNWLDCIRSRRDPIAAAEIAHRSCSVCILGDIAMRLGAKLKWDPQAERFTNSEEANRMLSRPYRGEWHV